MQEEELACFHVLIEVDNNPPTCLDCGAMMEKAKDGSWVESEGLTRVAKINMELNMLFWEGRTVSEALQDAKANREEGISSEEAIARLNKLSEDRRAGLLPPIKSMSERLRERKQAIASDPELKSKIDALLEERRQLVSEDPQWASEEEERDVFGD